MGHFGRGLADELNSVQLAQIQRQDQFLLKWLLGCETDFLGKSTDGDGHVASADVLEDARGNERRQGVRWDTPRPNGMGPHPRSCFPRLAASSRLA